jgi:hypothetical protein
LGRIESLSNCFAVDAEFWLRLDAGLAAFANVSNWMLQPLTISATAAES